MKKNKTLYTQNVSYHIIFVSTTPAINPGGYFVHSVNCVDDYNGKLNKRSSAPLKHRFIVLTSHRTSLPVSEIYEDKITDTG